MMLGTKIIQLLKAFSRKEIREFGKFVRSPFHNNRKDVIRYFDILKKYHPDFTAADFTKENIFARMYPGKKFNPEANVLLNTYLYNLGKEYLAIQDLKEDKFYFKYHLLKNLDQHESNNLFDKEFKNACDYLNDESFDINHFYRKATLEDLGINFNLKRNRQDKVCRSTIDFCNFSVYSFIVNLSKNYHDMLAGKCAFNYEFMDSAASVFINNFNFQQFIDNLKIEDPRYCNYILYYYYHFMCNYYPENDSYYALFKDHSFREFDTLCESERMERFHYLIDYCLMQIESGNLKYLRETFELYKEAFDKKLYLTNSKDNDINLFFFRNFVMVGLAAREFDFIENFISVHGKNLKGNTKKDMLNICSAMLHFEKKEYETALDYLSRMEYSYPAFRLGIKHLYTKIYFEIDDHSSFFPLIDAYKHYLKNDKTLPDRTKELHYNFLNYASKLAKIKFSNVQNGISMTLDEISKSNNLDFRHKLWLMDKAKEMIG